MESRELHGLSTRLTSGIQKKGTGVITDKDFKVVARLGAAVDAVTQSGRRPPER